MALVEQWLPVEGFEDYYLVSNTGKIYSLWNNRIIKPLANSATRYLSVCLCRPGIRKREYVHRIVANVFCEKTEGCRCINHKDENRQNNNADNLEWCTYTYNNTYNGKSDMYCKAIVQIKDGNDIRVWKSAREAEKHFKTNYKNISAVCRGLRPRAGGYEWRFL